MSHLQRKPQPGQENYSPREEPAIVEIAAHRREPKELTSALRERLRLELVSLPELKLVGRMLYTDCDAQTSIQTKALVDGFYRDDCYTRIPHKVNPMVAYGVSIDFWKMQGPCQYLYGTEVSSFDGVPGDMETWIIPAARYVRIWIDPNDEQLFDYLDVLERGDIGDLCGQVFRLMKRWCAEQGLSFAQADEFERYDGTQAGFYQYIPVV